MDRVIYTAMTGAKWTMERQAAVAQNLANASTSGYRAEEHRLRAVPLRSEALPSRAFVVDASVRNDYTPGPLSETGRVLDVAVQGKGWIALSMPDGSEAYTRDGHLEVGANGVLQTARGLNVMGDGGPISVPPDTEITLGAEGTVSVVPRTGNINTVNNIGRIKLVNPPEQNLVRGNDGLFRLASGARAEAAPEVRIASGYVEGSNVNVVDQVVSMISLSRQFEMQTRMLRTAEENDQQATQLLANSR